MPKRHLAYHEALVLSGWNNLPLTVLQIDLLYHHRHHHRVYFRKLGP